MQVELARDTHAMSFDRPHLVSEMLGYLLARPELTHQMRMVFSVGLNTL